jgi:hypothetical protein
MAATRTRARPVPPRVSGRNRRWVVHFVALGLVGATILLLVAQAGDSGPPPRADPGVVHVHGLGVDPGDGALYAATHSGLFRITEAGEAERVGSGYQDTMGFTVVGRRSFLGSGHPDLRDRHLWVEGKPPLLGLIESTDAGQTWRSLSLLGDADFHALAARHGRVYGYDSTGRRFMVSFDRRQWETRSAVELVAFAVSPKDPNRIVAATGGPVLLSTDGGRSWQEVEHAPALMFVAWPADSGIWGIAPHGALMHSSDAAAWLERGRLPGRGPEALTVAGETLYVATTTGIHRSTDGGRKWDLRYRVDQ